MKKKEFKISKGVDLYSLYLGIFIGILANFFVDAMIKRTECYYPDSCSWVWFALLIVSGLGLLILSYKILKLIETDNRTKNK